MQLKIWINPIIKNVLLNGIYRHNIFYGGRGGGKSVGVSDFLVLDALSNSNCYYPCIREFQASLRKSSYKEIINSINAINNRAQVEVISYKTKNNEIVLSNGSVFEFFGLSDSTGTARSGKSYSSNSDRVIEVENDNLLIEQNYTIQQNRVRFVWVEEAQDITDKSFNLMKNTFRDKESRLIYTMNPTNIYNPIYKMTTISNPDVKSAKINWNDNPYFPPVLKKEMELDKQLLDSMMWDHIWNGEVYSEKAQYFNIQDLKNCLDQKTFSNNGMVYAGVDLATGDGADKSVICVRKSNKILDMIILNTNKEREMAQMIVNAINKYHIDIVAVDNGNIGHSVINELAYLGRIEGIYPIDFGGRATDTKKFINKRNEMYWNLRTQIKLGCCFTTNDGVVLNELVKELSYIVWDTSKEPPQLQNKDRIKKELGHSPDFADAFALTFAVDGVNTNTLKSDEILSIANYKMQENIF